MSATVSEQWYEWPNDTEPKYLCTHSDEVQELFFSGGERCSVFRRVAYNPCVWRLLPTIPEPVRLWREKQAAKASGDKTLLAKHMTPLQQKCDRQKAKIQQLKAALQRRNGDKETIWGRDFRAVMQALIGRPDYSDVDAEHSDYAISAALYADAMQAVRERRAG